MKIKPLEGKIIVEPLQEDERTTESGIVIASTTAENMRFIKGKVLVAAKEKYVGEKLVPMTVKASDIVYFDEYITKELTLNGQRLYMMTEDKVYGILEEE